MTTQLSKEDSQRLLDLLQRQGRNQRIIYLLLAIAVAGATAALLHLIWCPTAASPGVFVAFARWRRRQGRQHTPWRRS